MNNFKNLLAALLMLVMCFPALAQENMYQVKGKVLDPYTNAPIEGAIVGATGLTLSVTTDVNGEFEMEIPSLRGTINAWAVGYYTQVLPISGRTYIEMILISEDTPGYSENAQVPLEGTVEASSLISSANYLDGNNINLNKSIVEQTFLTVPGIHVIDKSGMPGEGSYFTMRGVKSFTAKTSPLIILNGTPVVYDLNESPVINGYSKSFLNGISPRDVKNITFLSGADAAVYGSMASNGVIMIETDKAVDLDTKVEFIGQYGINMNQVTMPLLNTSEYKNYVNSVAVTNYSLLSDIERNFPFLMDNPNYYWNFLYNNNTDWQDEIYRPGFFTDNILKIKGGDAIAKYDISAGYMGNAGQIENTKYDKYYVRFNSDVNMSRKLTLSVTLATSYMNSTLMEQGMSLQTNPMLTAFRKSPLLSPFKKDADNNIRPVLEEVGSVFTSQYNAQGGGVNNAVSNPLAVVNEIQAESKVYDIVANGTLKYTINDNFALTGIAGMYYNMNRESMFIPGVSSRTIMQLGDYNNVVRDGVAQTFNTYFSLLGSYKKTFNDLHEVSASLGAQMTMLNNEYDAGEGYNTATDFYRTLNNTGTVGRSFFGYNDIWNWLNFNAKVQYVYNNVIGVGAVISSDRSSATGKDAQLYGFYPAFNVALFLKNTPFLNDVDFINRLTVRGDYTIVGNSQYATSLSKYNYNGNRYREVTGIVRTGIPNTKLKPEVTSTISAAVDASFFNYRVNLTAQYYNAKSKDLILQKSISSAFGTSYMYDNVGEVRNQGFEIGAQVSIINKKDLNWYVAATINANKDEILSLGNNNSIITEFDDGSALISQVGGSMYNFYGVQALGVYSTTEEALRDGHVNINGSPFQGGDVKFVDRDYDGVIGSRDRVALGSAAPDFFGSISTGFQYKNLGVSATFGYSYGNEAYNATRRMMESSSDYANQYRSVASRWLNEGQQTNMPRAAFGDPQDNNRFSSRYIEDASYIKLKEVMVSYRFPVMNGITVYVTGENLFTITDYLGLDPEFSYSYSTALQGFDYSKVPLPRSIKFGVKLQF